MTEDFQLISHIDAGTSIPATIKLWEVYLKDQGKSIFTIKAFLGDMHLLTKFLPPDITIGDITTNDLSRFFEWLENGRGKNIPCTPKSLARRVTTIKSFFRWLKNNGRISFDPAKDILQHSVISPLPEILTSREMEKVIKTSLDLAESTHPDARPYVLLKLLLETGIKKSECLNIRLLHIFSEGGMNYLFVRYPDQKDRNKERKIELSGEWYTRYHQYLEQYEPTDRVFPWSPRRLEYILEDIGKAAGLEKHLSFSMCRWNSALLDRMSGVEPENIRQKLGISKIQWREISMKLKNLSGLNQ